MTTFVLHPMYCPLPPDPGRLLLPKPPDPPQWLCRLAMGCAKSHMHMFAAWSDIGLDDVFQCILVKLIKSLSAFSPSRGVPRDAFLAVCAHHAAIGMFRSRSLRSRADDVGSAITARAQREDAEERRESMGQMYARLRNMTRAEFARAVRRRVRGVTPSQIKKLRQLVLMS